jgi:diguanylate cyclase (GGDEF)-like protein
MTNPLFYILVALTLTSATISLIFLMVWWFLGRKSYAISWSLGFLAATFQWTFNILASSFPSYESYWLTVNGLSLVLIVLGLIGHRQRARRGPPARWVWLGGAAVFSAIAWTTIVDPHVGIRTALVPITAAISLLISAGIVIMHRARTRPAEYAAAAMMLIVGATQLVAGSIAIMQGAAGDDAWRSLYVYVNFLTLPAGYAGLAMFVILMLASDLLEQMKEVAIRDQLTSLLNRRGFLEHGNLAFASARRSDRQLSVIMTDIDRFKQVNDEFGHAVGDAALRHFADVLRSMRRAEDILARVGGEEFALILPGTSIDVAIRIADELCTRVERTAFKANGLKLRLTASFGVAELSTKDMELSDIFLRADRALYRSKRDGRNRVDLESSQYIKTANGQLEPAAGAR